MYKEEGEKKKKKADKEFHYSFSNSFSRVVLMNNTREHLEQQTIHACTCHGPSDLQNEIAMESPLHYDGGECV